MLGSQSRVGYRSSGMMSQEKKKRRHLKLKMSKRQPGVRRTQLQADRNPVCSLTVPRVTGIHAISHLLREP